MIVLLKQQYILSKLCDHLSGLLQIAEQFHQSSINANTIKITELNSFVKNTLAQHYAMMEDIPGRILPIVEKARADWYQILDDELHELSRIKDAVHNQVNNLLFFFKEWLMVY